MFPAGSPTDINAMTIRGTYKQDGQAYSFVVRQMRPHYYRIDLDLGGLQSSQIFDNHWGWFLEEQDGVRQVRWMRRQESRNMARDSLLFNYLIEWPREDVRLKYLPPNAEGEPGVEVTLSDGDVITYRLDQQTYLVSQEIKANANGGGFRVMKHGDYRAVEGVMLSFEVTHYVLGNQVAELEIADITFNNDQPQLLFTAPILDKPAGYPNLGAPITNSFTPNE